jgi:hypothetical protein
MGRIVVGLGVLMSDGTSSPDPQAQCWGPRGLMCVMDDCSIVSPPANHLSSSQDIHLCMQAIGLIDGLWWGDEPNGWGTQMDTALLQLLLSATHLYPECSPKPRKAGSSPNSTMGGVAMDANDKHLAPPPAPAQTAEPPMEWEEKLKEHAIHLHAPAVGLVGPPRSLSTNPMAGVCRWTC